MKKPGRTAVILFGICAVTWTVRAVVDVIYQVYNVSAFVFALDLLCALLWSAAFIGCLRKYRSGQENAEK